MIRKTVFLLAMLLGVSRIPAQIILSGNAHLHVNAGTTIHFLQNSDSLHIRDSSTIKNDGVINFQNNSGITEVNGFPIYGSGFEVSINDTLSPGFQNPANLGFKFHQMTGYGYTKIYRFHSDTLSQISPFIGVKRYFKVVGSINNIDSTLQITFDSTELNGLASDKLKIIQIDNGLNVHSTTVNNMDLISYVDSLTTFAITSVAVNLDSVSTTVICGNDSIVYNFTTLGPFNSGNQFNFFLSNGIDTILLNTSVSAGGFSVFIPDSLQGSPYQIAIQSTYPVEGDVLTQPLLIHNLPTVIFSDPTPECENKEFVIINSASPPGGVFSGIGISNDTVFVSSLGDGIYEYVYTYTDLYNCSNTDTATFIIHPVDSISFLPITDFCETDSIHPLVEAIPSGGIYSGIGVTNGFFDPGIGPGTFEIDYVYTNGSGCVDSSSMMVDVFAIPVIPIITQNGNILTSTPEVSYQWYFNGNPISGETSQSINCDSSGNYMVEVGNASGCSAISDSYFISLIGVEEIPAFTLQIYPNPAIDLLTVQLDKPLTSGNIELFNTVGELVFEAEIISNLTIDVSRYSQGYYQIRINSDEIQITEKIAITR